MKKERRWIKSVLLTAAQPVPALAWQRQNRRQPVALKPAPKTSRVAAAAH